MARDGVEANPVIALAARRPVGLLMISAAIFVFGIISLLRLPMDLMPDVAYPSITVRTAYPGAAPEDVEDRVSRRLEQSLSVVKGLRRISSISRAESSDVILEFAWDTDMKRVVQEMREKIDQTFLPDDADPPTVLRYDPSLDPVLQIGLVTSDSASTHGDERDRIRGLKWLRRVAEEEVERNLETTPGVAAVKVRGGFEEEIRIEVDEKKIRSRGITLQLIAQRLREENLDQASGLLEEGDVAYVVRTLNEFRTLEEISSIPLRRDGDSITRLSDVAVLVPSYKEERVITRIDGRPAVKIEVYREAGANIVDLVGLVRKRLFGTPAQRERLKTWRSQSRETFEGDLRKTDGEKEGAESGENSENELVARPAFIEARLPDGVAPPRILSDQSTFIESSIRDLYQTALLGGLLAVLVLYLFLRKFSYTAVVALSIPFSVVTTFAPMYIGDITLNIMSLGGLALGMGMLVDSSIVVLEAIFRRREEGESAMDSAIHGASEVGGAVFASTLTTVAVFFPIVFIEGMAGQVFRDQALTVVFSLLAALVAALTLIPMLAARFGARGGTTTVTPSPLRSYSFGSLQSVAGLFREYREGRRRRLILVALFFFVTVPYYLSRLAVELVGVLLLLLYLGLSWLLGRILRGVSRASGGFFEIVLRGFHVLFDKVEVIYAGILAAALRQRFLVVVVALLSVVGAYFAARELGSELIPPVAQGEFTVHLRYPVGTPIETTEERVSAYERRLAEIPEVETVATTIGVDPDDVEATDEGEHTARFQIRLRQTRDKPQELERRVLEEVSRILSGVSDFTLEVSRPALFSFKDPVEVEVRGHDLTTLRTLGRQVEQLMQGIPALTDVRSNVAPGNPEYLIYPDRDKMARHDITSQQLADVLRRKNMGEVATRYREVDRKVDVRVQVDEQHRDSIEDLLGLIVAPRTGGGGWTLGDLVEGWEVREGPSEIRRIGQQRASVVTAGLEGLDLGRVTGEIEQALLREVYPVLPPDFSAEVVGQKREMERSRESLLGALLLAIFLVYVVMASQFESLIQPLIILFTIPLAAVGVAGTLFVTGTTLSVMSFIGMIMLTGIVVNNAIVLIDQVNRFRRRGLDVLAALKLGARRRLRPILMTTLTTVLGMIPITGVLAAIPHDPALDFILGSGQGAEIRAPLAYTVIGGLLSSTILTLIVIPVVYSLVIRDRTPPAGEEVLP